MVLGNGEEADIIMFSEIGEKVKVIVPTPDELALIFRQLDVLDITNQNKAVLRKSQRQIDQKIAWKVFKRDGYRCVYCSDDDTALTVDHLVLWEDGGDTVKENLVSACKKCNHTRGSKTVPEFLASDYYAKVSAQTSFTMQDQENMKTWIMLKYEKAQKLPLRPTKRSR